MLLVLSEMVGVTNWEPLLEPVSPPPVNLLGSSLVLLSFVTSNPIQVLIWVVVSTTVSIILLWLLLKMLVDNHLVAVVLPSPRKPSVDPLLLTLTMALGVINWDQATVLLVLPMVKTLGWRSTATITPKLPTATFPLPVLTAVVALKIARTSAVSQMLRVLVMATPPARVLLSVNPKAVVVPLEVLLVTVGAINWELLLTQLVPLLVKPLGSRLTVQACSLAITNQVKVTTWVAVSTTVKITLPWLLPKLPADKMLVAVVSPSPRDLLVDPLLPTLTMVPGVINWDLVLPWFSPLTVKTHGRSRAAVLTLLLSTNVSTLIQLVTTVAVAHKTVKISLTLKMPRELVTLTLLVMPLLSVWPELVVVPLPVQVVVVGVTNWELVPLVPLLPTKKTLGLNHPANLLLILLVSSNNSLVPIWVVATMVAKITLTWMMPKTLARVAVTVVVVSPSLEPMLVALTQLMLSTNSGDIN